MTTYGYRAGAIAQDFGDTDSVNSRNELVTVGPPMTEHGWFYELRSRMGRKTATSAQTTLELRSVTTGTNPNNVLGRTDEFLVATAMVDKNGGVDYVRPLQSAVRGSAGVRYALGWVACDGTVGYGYLPAANIAPGHNMTQYRRSLSVPTPQSPMGYTETSPGFGWLAVSAEYEANVKPKIPASLLPADNAVGLSLTPTFSGNFRDDNETLPNGLSADKLLRFQLHVWDEATGLDVWNATLSATAAQQATRSWSAVYAGSALVPGQVLNWTARVQDLCGVWSDLTLVQRLTVGGPAVDVSTGTPSGTIQDPTPDFTAVYQHLQGTNSDAFRVRLNDVGSGNTVQTSAWRSLAVVPNGAVSLLWTDLTGLTSIAWGDNLTWQMQARDALLQESSWSAKRAFKLNAAPSVPVLISPDNAETVTSRPEIVAICLDEDDTSGTGLQVWAEILGPYVIANPGFEVDALNWQMIATPGITTVGPTRTTAVVDSGTGSGQVQVSANTAGVGSSVTVRQSDFQPCLEGAAYNAQVRVRTTNVDLVPRLSLRWYTAADVLISATTEGDYAIPVNSWVNRAVTYVAPATAAKLAIAVQLYSRTANQLGTVYLDQVALQPGARTRRALTFDGTLVDWDYPIWRGQTDATDLPVPGAYELQLVSFDGTIYSGGKTTLAAATRSPKEAFTYLLGPTVTNVAPAAFATVPSSVPDYDWTFTGQTKKRVQVWQTFEDGSEFLIWDTGEELSTSTQREQAPGFLEDGGSYYRKVWCWDALNNMGVSPDLFFTVTFAPPDAPPNLSGSPLYATYDVFGQQSAILLAWGADGYDESEHEFWRISRRAVSGTPYDVDDQIRGNWVVVADLTGLSETAYTDHTPAANVVYEYGVQHVVRVAGKRMTGKKAIVEAGVTFQSTIISDARRGGTRRAVMLYRDDRDVEPQRDQEFETPWGQNKPVELRSRSWSRQVSGSFQIVTDSVQDTEEIVRQLETMDAVEIGGSAYARQLLWRDGRGHRWFGTITKLHIKDKAGSRVRKVDITFQQTNAGEVIA